MFLAAEEPKPINSSISSSASAIEARTRMGSSVNRAQGASTLKHGTPGDVLNNLSLADTFLTQPPPLVSISAVGELSMTTSK